MTYGLVMGKTFSKTNITTKLEILFYRYKRLCNIRLYPMCCSRLASGLQFKHQLFQNNLTSETLSKVMKLSSFFIFLALCRSRYSIMYGSFKTHNKCFAIICEPYPWQVPLWYYADSFLLKTQRIKHIFDHRQCSSPVRIELRIILPHNLHHCLISVVYRLHRRIDAKGT